MENKNEAVPTDRESASSKPIAAGSLGNVSIFHVPGGLVDGVLAASEGYDSLGYYTRFGV